MHKDKIFLDFKAVLKQFIQKFLNELKILATGT